MPDNPKVSIHSQCTYIRENGIRCGNITLSSSRLCHIHRERGYFSTKQWVVELLLDLMDYSTDNYIERYSVLDPGCGDGNFIIGALDRYISRVKKIDMSREKIYSSILNKFLGIDSHPPTVLHARNQVRKMLIRELNSTEMEAIQIAKNIIKCDDFLTINLDKKFDFIIGNPPYIRYDAIDKEKREEIKKNYIYFKGRSDLIVPFIERSLSLLSRIGQLGFICTNRFAFSEYGKGIRSKIMNEYKIRRIIDFSGIKPFNKSVDVYPWMLIISNNAHGDTIEIGWIKSKIKISTSKDVRIKWHSINHAIFNQSIWNIFTPSELKLWTEIKSKKFTTINDTSLGFNIHVGVATGADSVFINPIDDDNHVEKELLYPIILSSTVDGHTIVKPKDWLLNTWILDQPGNVINLNQWPLAQKYLQKNKQKLESRFISRKNPHNWYRLIDKITSELIGSEKLLVPNLKQKFEIYYDPGGNIPHHNFYYIVKDSSIPSQYTLKMLGAVLRSSIIQKLASSISIPFKGGAIRLMKSQLLQIPIPRPELLIEHTHELEHAFIYNDIERIDEIINSFI